ncbi:uncharacterized protein LOC124924066 [Impatiens glandulifera]|uniref:uncharacterized protein LOC124924066 n=1 Tax=Impatiens glandulifera TaxID=253017 RepID=UPI001FB0670D|nr:uncharacterized protein LOC124924066 [Impatiens glandulifera]XP_047320071.1 uncharacterized protein LOC124924066 [Impatiens glandulifera]
MGRGKKVVSKKDVKGGIGCKGKGSDDSDEDYTVGEDEACNESDENCSSFAGEESDESLFEFEEDLEEDEEEDNKKRKVRRSEGRYCPNVKKSTVGNVPKKRRISYKEEDDESCKDEDDDEDVEFTPDEIDLDDEDEISEERKVPRQPSWEKGIVKKHRSNTLKKSIRKKPRKRVTNNSSDLPKRNRIVKGRKKKNSNHKKRRRRFIADSDSDYMSSKSKSSDFEYTISEEEREQIREASDFCRNLGHNLLEEGEIVKQRNQPDRKTKVDTEDMMHEVVGDELEVYHQKEEPQTQPQPRKKGKEKVDDLKNEEGKQVCGICFTEEGKRMIRGTLNCCSHYFCFACIFEWSKVESRCPLCKQRFESISKPSRSNVGFDLPAVVMQIPERDQVYQPSEEELRSYIDPYENVFCTECQQGGDDALMLLCDICDSPAHTYCVGLGRQVPDGNWYCEGCRPTDGSSIPPLPNPSPDQRTTVNPSNGTSSMESIRQEFDLNEAYVPETSMSHVNGFLSSFRQVGVNSSASSQVSRAGPRTVSVRRRIQLQIHHHLLNNSVNPFPNRNRMAAATLGISDTNILGVQTDRSSDVAFQPAVAFQSTSPHMFFQGRPHVAYRPQVPNWDFLPLPSQLIQGQTSTSANDSTNRILQPGLQGMNMYANSRLEYGLSNPFSSRLNAGSDVGISVFGQREVSNHNLGKEQVQLMVMSHLKGLSRHLELGHDSLEDISRSSTHTILAVCGLEHLDIEVCPVRVAPSTCNHVKTKEDDWKNLLKGICQSCFDSFVKDVVREIMNKKVVLPFYLL